MSINKFFSAVGLLTILAMPSWSATSPTVGRITYIYPDNHRIILNSEYDYDLGSAVDGSKLKVAQLVRLTLSNEKGQRAVTQVGPGPLSAANN